MPTPTPFLQRLISLAAAASLLAASLALGQDSRPRRVPQPTDRTPQTNEPAQPAPQPTPQRPTPRPTSLTTGATLNETTGATTGATTNATTDAPLVAPAASFARLDAEPFVRVGLATGARSATVSTSGQLLLVSDEFGREAAPRPVESARVRIEPRVLAPLPATSDGGLFRVEIAAVESEAEARRVAREAQALTGEAPQVTREPRANNARSDSARRDDARGNGTRDDDARGDTWRVSVGPALPRAEAEELRARLEEAGVATFSIAAAPDARPSGATRGTDQLASNRAGATKPGASSSSNRSASRLGAPVARDANSSRGPNSQRNSNSTGNANPARGTRQTGGVRLASRAEAAPRGLVVYSSGSAQLLNARAPVTFASADEQAAPLRFNERPYRGRIEVFTNSNGSLTVVNVVRLEDYVRGVVPNELSPGGYPALEALKAQAVAARTYALGHRGQFNSAGFDLLPTTRSQVYGGKSTEHALTDRAVFETRGLVATYAGRPINALYTSTCGGHTEDAEKIFGGEPVPYLRGRACSVEAHLQTAARASAPYTIQTTREPVAVRDAERARGPRDAALLAVHGFPAPARITDDWLSDDIEPAEVRQLLALAARLAHRPAPAVPTGEDPTRPPAFASALALALDGESRADVLLDAATVEYLLAFRDAADIPARNRADVALLLRDGHLTLLPDATLRPRQQLTRSRALRAAASLLEARGLFQTQKATARPSDGGALVIRPARGGERALTVAPDAHLFRAFGDGLFAVRSVQVVGGEPVQFHLDARGAVDYLEVRPAPNGASAERFSPFTNWTSTLTTAEVAQRLARHAGRVGQVVDLRVAARGVSRRVLDLEVVGTSGTAHVRGGRIRSALGLREQLFFVEPRRDEAGRAVAFVFTGRGWGHGVGLCQVGAYGLARAGHTHEQILKHYYTGIELSRLY